MRQIIQRAMQQSDDLVMMIDYTDSQGMACRRVVSPIRFLSQDRFLAICLCREEPRQFVMNRCGNVRLVPASDVLMPVPLVPLAACA